jgi:hypothetical protein
VLEKATKQKRADRADLKIPADVKICVHWHYQAPSKYFNVANT